MNVEHLKKLENMKCKIENMNKNYQLEVLNILKKNISVKLNENKNGVYVNLSFLPNETILELENYVNYIKDQENSIEVIESQKNDFKNTFFSKLEGDIIS